MMTSKKDRALRPGLFDYELGDFVFNARHAGFEIAEGGYEVFDVLAQFSELVVHAGFQAVEFSLHSVKSSCKFVELFLCCVCKIINFFGDDSDLC